MEEAYVWYEERQAGLGAEFLRCVDACMASIRSNPETYPVVHNEIRMALVRRFPYLLFYTPELDQITIFSIFHAARDPKIWRQRS